MEKNYWSMLVVVFFLLTSHVGTYAQSVYSERELTEFDNDTNEPGGLLWNLKAGGMLWKRTSPQMLDEKEGATDILAGLGVEIPLNRKLNIETGLRWKYVYALLQAAEGMGNGDNNELDEQMHLLELPVRLMYKWQLKDNLSLHVGAGPYASMPIAYSFDGDDSFLEERPKGKLNIGLETAAVLYWGNFNVGLHYNIPIHKGYKDGYNNRVELTLGIRFKSKFWEKLGDGVIAADNALRASGAYDAIDRLAETYGSGESSSSSGNSKGSTYKKASTPGNKYSISEQQNFNDAKEAYQHNEDLLIKARYGNIEATPQEIKHWQSEMKKIRIKWEKRGKRIEKSQYEGN